jgi:hypothetical protein
MIYLVTGAPGNGKSYFTVLKAPELLPHEGRTIYYHGIPELTLPWEPADGETWYNLPDGSAIVIDEAQSVFRPMPAGADRPRKVRDLETHRHRGFDIWLITQHPNLIDSHVRRLVGKHYHVHRPFGIGAANVWEWEKAANPEDYHEKKLAVKSRINFKREIWSRYKSATIHTVKRRLPWKLMLLPLSLATVGGLAWFGYSSLRGSIDKGERTQAPPSVKGTVLPASTRLDRAVRLVESRQPLIPELPWSAPRYEHMTRPVAMPVVRGCFEDRRWIPARCWCVSQRGTKVDTSKAFCEGVVRDGLPFYDFEPDRETVQEGQAAPGAPLPVVVPAPSSDVRQVANTLPAPLPGLR